MIKLILQCILGLSGVIILECRSFSIWISIMSGEHYATPNSHGEGRRAAPSHANCSQTSTRETAVPEASKMSLSAWVHATSPCDESSTNRPLVCKETVGIKHSIYSLKRKDSQECREPGWPRTTSFTNCIVCSPFIGHVWQRYWPEVSAWASLAPSMSVIAISMVSWGSCG